ncbi:hypothetical protein ACHAW5_009018 [Stephanodiscus triporus]|uniref:Uncharacterized protein n=1 Tax=Stephanodiscus triporus TaxID=2934178 RepID=A0ABD3QZU1_9STRA
MEVGRTPPPASSSTTLMGLDTRSPGERGDGEHAELDEARKQSYIQRYGLLPTITPLSKRYGQMKRQQQQQQLLQCQGQGPSAAASKNAAPASILATGSSAATAAVATAHNGKLNNNARKRRGDLLGAASRLGRHRRSRLTTTQSSSSLPTIFLGRNRTPKRGRDEDEATARANERVWRRASRGEKENRANGQSLSGHPREGSVAKRGKFDPDAVADVDGDNDNDGGGGGGDFVVGTPPPKNPIDPLTPSRHVMTPPKTPFPRKFSLVTGTATPAKPSFPLSLDVDDREGATILSFGTTTASTADREKKSATASVAPGFSFGAVGETNNAVASVKGGMGVPAVSDVDSRDDVIGGTHAIIDCIWIVSANAYYSYKDE